VKQGTKTGFSFGFTQQNPLGFSHHVPKCLNPAAEVLPWRQYKQANVHNRRANNDNNNETHEQTHTETHTQSNGMIANALQFMSISTLHRNIGTGHPPRHPK